MKKAICLTLAALTLAAVLTGCTGITGAGRNNMKNVPSRRDGIANSTERDDMSNVSTRRDGIVNGTGRNSLIGEDGILNDVADKM